MVWCWLLKSRKEEECQKAIRPGRGSPLGLVINTHWGRFASQAYFGRGWEPVMCVAPRGAAQGTLRSSEPPEKPGSLRKWLVHFLGDCHTLNLCLMGNFRLFSRAVDHLQV